MYVYIHTYIYTYEYMYVCIYICIYIYIYIYIYIHVHIYIYIHIYIYAYIMCPHTYLYIRIYHVHIHICTYLRIYIHVHIYTYVYIYTYTYTHTYIHIHTHTYTHMHIYIYITHIHMYTYTHINISEGPDGIARPTCGRAKEGPTVVAAALCSGRKRWALRRIGWFGAERKKTKSNARLKSMEKKSSQTAASKPTCCYALLRLQQHIIFTVSFGKLESNPLDPAYIKITPFCHNPCVHVVVCVCLRERESVRENKTE